MLVPVSALVTSIDSSFLEERARPNCGGARRGANIDKHGAGCDEHADAIGPYALAEARARQGGIGRIGEYNLQAPRSRIMIETLLRKLRRKKTVEGVGTKVVAVPPRFYRYRGLNDYTWESLKNGTIYMSDPGQLNDILDARFLVQPRKLTEAEEQTLRGKMAAGTGLVMLLTKSPETDEFGIFPQDSDKFSLSDGGFFPGIKRQFEAPALSCGICCFSEVPDSAPMWAHYADNHRGICIEYEADEELFDRLADRSLSLYQISYKKNNRVIDPMDFVEFSDMLLTGFITEVKGPEWSYEREWRLVSPQSSISIKAPFRVSKVIFGNRADHDTIGKTISSIGWEKDVNYYACLATKSSHSIEFIPAELAFGPIAHRNSIFEEVRDFMREKFERESQE